jgi:DNA-repair protein complementing XP-A cells
MKRIEKKFKMKIVGLKKKTQTEAYRKALKTGGKHEHEWGIPVENEGGDTVKICSGCWMEIAELVCNVVYKSSTMATEAF